MAVSQNGYSANDRSLIGTYDIPGGKITARKGDVSVILLYIANRFHREVESLIWPGNWGYAERPIRGGSALSNHASGTAIDLNAPRHPLGKVNTFNATQRAKIRAILNYLEGVVRWGGDYTGRKDDMHFEINAGSASVKRVADKIRRAGGLPTGPAAPSTSASDNIKWIQQRLTYWGFPTTADGLSGPKTTAAIKAFQGAKGLVVDGLVGPKTKAALAANKPTAPKPSPTGQYHSIPLGGVSDLYASGEQVRRDQAGLAKRGYAIKADGYWGPGSVAVGKAFQKAAGLKVDGAIGPVSRAAAAKVPAFTTDARQWQTRLKARGWRITVDGIWGPHSTSILRQFQAEKKLHAAGIRNPESWTAVWAHPIK